MRVVRPLLLLTLFTLVAPSGRSTRADEEETPTTVASDVASAESALSTELRSLATVRDYTGILRAADGTLRERADSVVAWAYRGFALQRLARKPEAAAAYRRATEIDAEHVWALTQLGALLTESRDYREARVVLSRAAALEPGSLEVARRLTHLLRELGVLDEAVAAVERALAAGVNVTWAHSELGYLHWARGDATRSATHWRRAAAAGADAADVEHGLRLLTWDRELAAARETSPPDAFGDWRFSAGRIRVQTAIGPQLPAEVAADLLELDARYLAFFEGALLEGKSVGGESVGGQSADASGAVPESRARELPEVRLVLSRTMEEHEQHRRQHFPSSAPGRAFSRPVVIGGSGRSRDVRWRVDMYVPWARAGFATSLSHELVHACVVGRAAGVPVWLDEGLATYLETGRRLETGRHSGGLPATGEVRADLVEALTRMHAEGAGSSLRQIFTYGRSTFEGAQGRARYAEAWSVVHFLLHRDAVGERAAGARRFHDMLGAFAGRQGDPLGPIRSQYGADLAELDREWIEYLRDLGVRVAPR